MFEESIMTYMRDLLGITGTDAKELFECYVETLEELCKKLEEAVERRDVMEVRNITHSIVGSSTNIGANTIAEHAILINEAAKSHDFCSVESSLQKLKEYSVMLRQ